MMMQLKQRGLANWYGVGLRCPEKEEGVVVSTGRICCFNYLLYHQLLFRERERERGEKKTKKRKNKTGEKKISYYT